MKLISNTKKKIDSGELHIDFDSFKKHVDEKTNLFNVPTQDMDEEQLDKDRQTKKMKKKDVGDEIDMDDEEDNSEEDFGDVEDDIEYTFVPNIKDEQKSQEEIMND